CWLGGALAGRAEPSRAVRGFDAAVERRRSGGESGRDRVDVGWGSDGRRMDGGWASGGHRMNGGCVSDTHREAIRWLADETGMPCAGAEQAITYLADSRTVLGLLPTQDTLPAARLFAASGGMQPLLH